KTCREIFWIRLQDSVSKCYWEWNGDSLHLSVEDGLALGVVQACHCPATISHSRSLWQWTRHLVEVRMAEARIRLLLLLLTVAATDLLLGTSWAVDASRTFKLLYKGEEMIDATYTYHGYLSRIVCAMKCYQETRCWVYTWDTVSRECQHMNEISSVIKIKSAAVSLYTYYVAGTDNYLMYLTPLSYTWSQGKVKCEVLGGRMALPSDTSYTLVLHHVFQDTVFFIGMWRAKDNMNVWYDLRGEVIVSHPLWVPGQPDNFVGDEFVVAAVNGVVAIILTGVVTTMLAGVMASVDRCSNHT
ncbi:putative C-type lectin fold-like, partial [Homarus americanus]